MLTQSVMLAFLFVGILFFTGGGTIAEDSLAPALLGYAIWFYATVAISDMSHRLQEEAQAGTLEQMYMSPAPSWVILLGRTLATLLITTTVFALVAIPLILLFSIQIPFRWSGLPVFVLTWLGIYGFGFGVGGATLLFKQVGSLTNLVQNMLLFLNGAFIPVDRFPDWLAAIAHIFPTTQGIVVLRRVILDGQSLASAWTDGSLSWLIIHSTLFFLGGLVVFSICERAAKRRGVMGQY
ncbi:ABC transporter permease [Chloroflexi bacterium TSY]|nr:ABC transporter permease [Chloroflexi bacterium TSY]